MGGIEPPSTVYETAALPLSYTGRTIVDSDSILTFFKTNSPWLKTDERNKDISAKPRLYGPKNTHNQGLKKDRKSASIISRRSLWIKGCGFCLKMNEPQINQEKKQNKKRRGCCLGCLGVILFFLFALFLVLGLSGLLKVPLLYREPHLLVSSPPKSPKQFQTKLHSSLKEAAKQGEELDSLHLIFTEEELTGYLLGYFAQAKKQSQEIPTLLKGQVLLRPGEIEVDGLFDLSSLFSLPSYLNHRLWVKAVLEPSFSSSQLMVDLKGWKLGSLPLPYFLALKIADDNDFPLKTYFHTIGLRELNVSKGRLEFVIDCLNVEVIQEGIKPEELLNFKQLCPK